jgi:hypothetical protein
LPSGIYKAPAAPGQEEGHGLFPVLLMLLMPMCRLVLLLLLPRFIRKVLDEAGGQAVKIISKIESWHGVTNFDDILAVTGQCGAAGQSLCIACIQDVPNIMTSRLPHLAAVLAGCRPARPGCTRFYHCPIQEHPPPWRHPAPNMPSQTDLKRTCVRVCRRHHGGAW